MNRFVPISADVEPVTLAKLERLADARVVTREALAADAIRSFVEREGELRALVEEDNLGLPAGADFEAWLEAFVAPGEASLARGDGKDHAAFMADLRHWRETRERPA